MTAPPIPAAAPGIMAAADTAIVPTGTNPLARAVAAHRAVRDVAPPVVIDAEDARSDE